MTFKRFDRGRGSTALNNKIRETNEQMKVLCRRYGAQQINNDNITYNLLSSKKRWHPTQDGKDVLVENWGNYINAIWNIDDNLSPIITTPSIISHYPELNLIPSHQEPCLDKGGAGKIPEQINVRSETNKSCFEIISLPKHKYYCQ